MLARYFQSNYANTRCTVLVFRIIYFTKTLKTKGIDIVNNRLHLASTANVNVVTIWQRRRKSCRELRRARKEKLNAPFVCISILTSCVWKQLRVSRQKIRLTLNISLLSQQSPIGGINLTWNVARNENSKHRETLRVIFSIIARRDGTHAIQRAIFKLMIVEWFQSGVHATNDSLSEPKQASTAIAIPLAYLVTPSRKTRCSSLANNSLSRCPSEQIVAR